MDVHEEVHSKFWKENLTGSVSLRYLGITRRILLHRC